jgi:uncharacterized RDD family membrane protein YckC
LRQSAQQVELAPSWKQEVSRRVAEHKGRTGASGAGQKSDAPQPPTGSRAAQAAARVAARYAQAPSYNDMLAEEARAAVRAAEAASRAALNAQAAAEQVLAGLEAVASATETWEQDFFTAPEPAWTPAAPEPVKLVAAAASAQQSAPIQQAPAGQQAARQPFEIRWDTDMPVRETSQATSRASRGAAAVETPAALTWEEARRAASPLEAQGFEIVEAALPIHANLIEFPRELVATRKARPRRAEGPYAASVEANGQLSIFEVDPGAISIDPVGAAEPVATSAADAAPWVGPVWSGIELDAEPFEEMAELAAPIAEPIRRERAETAAPAAAFELAPMHQRVLATLVDFSLISGAFLAAGFLASTYANVLPPLREMEIGSAVALALIAVLYQAVFFTLGRATPGMKYARLELRTFADHRPARAQRCARMAALLLSVLPIGLGVLWALFDEQHLCWHDRLSKTYPHKIWG